MNETSPNAIVQRLFLHAERRLGGAAALSGHLGIEPAQLAPYLAGTANPPADILLRTLSVVLDELDTVMRGHRESAWRSLMANYRSADNA